MAVKLRLTRKGRKKRPFYHIVAADERAPRDGRFIEKLGTYDPTTNPASISIDVDRSVDWLQKGAIPTNTVRAILSYRGVLYKNHLLKGALKGAFPMEEVEARFDTWMAGKDDQIQSKKDNLANNSADAAKAILEREAKIRQARAAAVLAKNSPLAEEVTEAESSELPAETEEVVNEAVEAAPVAVEAVVVEETPEAPVAEEAPAAEETPEAPAEEAEKSAE
jgi:small subunit ribosomal protein S16